MHLLEMKIQDFLVGNQCLLLFIIITCKIILYKSMNDYLLLLLSCFLLKADYVDILRVLGDFSGAKCAWELPTPALCSGRPEGSGGSSVLFLQGSSHVCTGAAGITRSHRHVQEAGAQFAAGSSLFVSLEFTIAVFVLVKAHSVLTANGNNLFS